LNLENYFISQFKSTSIGDDGAVIGEYIYSKDAFFEDVHFKREWMGCYDIARKAMLVNISDAVAMSAQPKYALLSVAMPKNISKDDMSELVRGFESVASKFGIKIIGGDTISNTKLDITVTIISKTKRPLLRKGLKDGYLLAYTGRLGQSQKELKKLMRLGSIHKKSKFIDIKLRDKFVQKTRRFLKVGMDISDGLFSDLEKLASLNKKGFRFYDKIPKDVGCSGEEYEMLIAFDKRDKKALIRHSAVARTPLNIFGESIRKKYTNRCKAHHF
jgi:thiamine-monophosphate kinase